MAQRHGAILLTQKPHRPVASVARVRQDDASAAAQGQVRIERQFEEEFHIQPGQTSDDGQLTVEIIYCMGSCALAPVAVLDNQVMARMQQDTLVSKVKKHIGVD